MREASADTGEGETLVPGEEKRLLKDKALSLPLAACSPEPQELTLGTALPQPGGGPHHLLPQLLSSNHHLCPVVLLRGFLLQAVAQALHAGLEVGGGGEMRPG